MSNSWCKIWRSQFNHWLSVRKPWCEGFAWSYIYTMANYKTSMVNFRNEYVEIHRGQFLTSRLKLQEKFGWTYKKVASFLKALENAEMCTNRTTNRFIVITILNYDKYQCSGLTDGKTEVVTEGKTEVKQNCSTIKRTSISSSQIENSNLNHEIKKPSLSNPDGIRLGEYLFNHIAKNKPNFKKPNIGSWARDFDLMIRIDKRSVAEIKDMIEWVQKDPFWWPNVLSPAKLRKQWDQLEAKRLSIKPAIVDKTDYSFEALVEAMR